MAPLATFRTTYVHLLYKGAGISGLVHMDMALDGDLGNICAYLAHCYVVRNHPNRERGLPSHEAIVEIGAGGKRPCSHGRRALSARVHVAKIVMAKKSLDPGDDSRKRPFLVPPSPLSTSVSFERRHHDVWNPHRSKLIVIPVGGEAEKSPFVRGQERLVQGLHVIRPRGRGSVSFEEKRLHVVRERRRDFENGTAAPERVI
mmetsp:Transcript_41218/g.66991  ORF Transcript_41218/g.66991 Transcript_41218/m.66991 type:complete len:202 (+) Transcript_41218:153-758(+)